MIYAYNPKPPTARDIRNAVARRHRWIAEAAAALAAGDDDRAFELDCKAFDAEVELRRHGYDPETGR